MPTSLFPVLALDVFKVGTGGLGPAGRGAGGRRARSGAVFSGWVPAVRRIGVGGDRRGRDLGRSRSRCSGCRRSRSRSRSFFLAIAGAADVLSAVFRSTIVQLETPDTLRGRVTLDPHPRRHERPADRRHRGGDGRVGRRRRSCRWSRAGCCAWRGSPSSPGCSRSSRRTSSGSGRRRRSQPATPRNPREQSGDRSVGRRPSIGRPRAGR